MFLITDPRVDNDDSRPERLHNKSHTVSRSTRQCQYGRRKKRI